jgi:hypothetical protein
VSTSHPALFYLSYRSWPFHYPDVQLVFKHLKMITPILDKYLYTCGTKRTIMSEKTGTRLRAPGGSRRYIAKISLGWRSSPDKEIQEKAGQISKLGDYMASGPGSRKLEMRRIRKLEKGDLCHQEWTGLCRQIEEPKAEEPCRVTWPLTLSWSPAQAHYGRWWLFLEARPKLGPAGKGPSIMPLTGSTGH